MTSKEDRSKLREIVRDGYDQISNAYRGDDGQADAASAETTSTYGAWIHELSQQLRPHARVLDLGCGAGVPASLHLASRGLQVTGLDFSEVQIQRARQLVPTATFVQADVATWDAPEATFDAVISLYALIHVPLNDQKTLIPRIRRWLVDGGYLLAIVGASRWSGIEDYFGTKMFWDHADTQTYLTWFRDAGLIPQWHCFIPEGDSGHTLVLARATN